VSDEEWAERGRRGAGIPCPVCTDELIVEPIYDEDTVTIALVCRRHGVARLMDPFR